MITNKDKHSAPMIGSWELQGISSAEQYYLLANAHAEAALLLASGLRAGSYPKTFSHAKVIMSLHHHAAELFLKYALNRARISVPNNHYLRDLHQKYTTAYPGRRFAFKLPFTAKHIEHTNQQIKEALNEESTPRNRNKSDQMLRYHTDTDGKPWPGINAIIPKLYRNEIAALKNRFCCLHELIEKQIPTN